MGHALRYLPFILYVDNDAHGASRQQTRGLGNDGLGRFVSRRHFATQAFSRIPVRWLFDLPYFYSNIRLDTSKGVALCLTSVSFRLMFYAITSISLFRRALLARNYI